MFLSFFASSSRARDRVRERARERDDAGNSLYGALLYKQRETISFEEFAQFYGEGGGYELAPWLELVNPDKFVYEGSLLSID